MKTWMRLFHYVMLVDVGVVFGMTHGPIAWLVSFIVMCALFLSLIRADDRTAAP